MLKKTSLYEEHKKLKARLVPFAGWEMPVQYSGVIQEHTAVRTHVGLFDVSHMGEIFITGERAEEFLNRVTSNDITKMQDGTCQYNLFCYENGTVVDDLIVSRIEKNHYLAVVNASNVQKDFEWMLSQNQEQVALTNRSDDFSLIAVQGPNSLALVNQVLGSDFSNLNYYCFVKHEFKKQNLFVMRTGYTGEYGFELMLPNSGAVALWQALMEQGGTFGVLPVGLGARDTLRLEVAYSLYGYEISDQINPLEANLGWVVKLQKGNFVGREALMQAKEQGLKRRVVGFEMQEPGIARDNCPVYVGDSLVGYVTSGTHSPTLQKALGLALVSAEYKELGTELLMDIRGKKKKAIVVKTPFYKRPA